MGSREGTRRGEGTIVKLPLVLRDAAEREFDEAFDWYDAEQPGTGMRFLNAVQKVFNQIAEMPQLYPPVLADVRKAVVRRFPYCIYYRAHPDRIEVIAVFHTSRDPRIWQTRAAE